ncbi:MAG TPA: rhomboid family intramembrane serine protease [Chthoniobacteraceae bacterium]|nr:rhomboid family intramembrane serine protease [Chthoniobacteraceae bacterium]
MMSFIDRLEYRFGRFAITGLIRMIVILNAAVFLLAQFNPAIIGFLDLTRAGLANHEYWRLFTYIFIPRTSSYLFVLLALMFLWSIGEQLEAAWGAFRLNLFYLIGMIGTTVAAVVFGAEYSNYMLNLSLLFAYAWFYPNQILLFPPIPIRWLAWFLAAYLAWQFLGGTWGARAAMIASLANWFLFFGPQIFADAAQRQKVAARRRKFEENSLPEDAALHRCAKCGRTEITSPELDFRVSSRDGEEYCVEHLPGSP